jgi:branched-chain amino acid transport system substrate-binding protein
MKMGKKNSVILFIVLVVGIIFARNGFSETLVIGANVPLTGPAAQFGLGKMRSLEMRIEEYNAKGGLTIKGVNYKMKLVAYDHKTQPGEAASVAKKLIYDDKTKYILAGAVGACCRAAETATIPNNVMFVFSCAGKELLGPDKPLNFRDTMSSEEQCFALLSIVKKANPHIKTIAVLSTNDTTGWDSCKGLIRAAEKLGIKCVAEEYFERDVTDFHPVLARILAKKPDLIDNAGTPLATGCIVFKQAYEMGYRGAKSWLGCGMPQGLVNMAGLEASEGVYLGSSWDYNDPKFNTRELGEKLKLYKARYGDEWDYTGLGTYASSKIIFDSMIKAQSLDPHVIAKTMLETQPHQTFLGPAIFGMEAYYGINRQILHPAVMGQIRKGKMVNAGYAIHPDLAKVVGDWKFPQ